MEFLVRTVNLLPPETPDDVRDRLREGERERAQELRDAGILKKLWRVPGRNATVGLYEADDPTALHDALVSLPMWKWMEVSVEALATHPQEKGR
jgi:muconolactone D-isomerase